MMPSCDQTGVPIHFHSSTTAASASLISLRTLARDFPRQSASSAMLFEMSSDADWRSLTAAFFMFSSYKFQTNRTPPAKELQPASRIALLSPRQGSRNFAVIERRRDDTARRQFDVAARGAQ